MTYVRNMSSAVLSTTLLMAAFLGTGATQAFGAAALAGGAKTSCKPTATSPALRQIQINADPLNVAAYQLTMSYPLNDVDIVNPNSDVFGVNGFDAAVVNIRSSGATGFVTVSGATAAPPPGEIDVFGVIFTLKPGVALDTVLHFTVFADPTNMPQDFIRAFDTDTGVQFTYPTNQISPSESGPVAIVPEPFCGLTGLAMLSGVMAGRRRR